MNYFYEPPPISHSKSAAATVVSGGYLATQKTTLALNTSDSKVRIGFIGTAHPHAPGKVAAVRDLDQAFELVGIVEPNPALREACKSKPEYQNISWLEESQLFETKDLQAVIIETDFPELLPSASRAVSRGLNVHLDKPPGKSLEELEKMLAEAHRRDVYVQMGYMLRYNPAFELCFARRKKVG